MKVVMSSDSRDDDLRRLVTQYQQDILRMCCAILRDQALAEDATQETFIKAWRGMDQFRGEALEKTWLMRIAINTCRDIQRTSWMRHAERRVPLDQAPDGYCDPEDILLSDAVLRLPRKLKEAVLLYYYQGMTLDDAAQALHISKTSVFSRLKRARAKLHDMLEGEVPNA